MEPDGLSRLYAEAAKNLSRSWPGACPTVFAANRRLADAAQVWGDEARVAAEVLTRAAAWLPAWLLRAGRLRPFAEGVRARGRGDGFVGRVRSAARARAVDARPGA